MNLLSKMFVGNFEKQGVIFLVNLEKNVKAGKFLEEDLLQLNVLREYFIKLRLQAFSRPESFEKRNWMSKYDWVDAKLLLLERQLKAKKVDSSFFEAIKDLKK